MSAAPLWRHSVDEALHAAVSSSSPAGSKPHAISGTDVRLDLGGCAFYKTAADPAAFMASLRGALTTFAGPEAVQATYEKAHSSTPHMRAVFHDTPAALAVKRRLGDQGKLTFAIGGLQVIVSARLIAGTKPPGWMVLIAHNPTGPPQLRSGFWRTVLRSAGYDAAAAACTPSFLPSHAGGRPADLDCGKIIAYAPPPLGDPTFSKLPRTFFYDGGSSSVSLVVADQDNAVRDTRPVNAAPPPRSPAAASPPPPPPPPSAASGLPPPPPRNSRPAMTSSPPMAGTSPPPPSASTAAAPSGLPPPPPGPPPSSTPTFSNASQGVPISYLQRLVQRATDTPPASLLNAPHAAKRPHPASAHPIVQLSRRKTAPPAIRFQDTVMADSVAAAPDASTQAAAAMDVDQPDDGLSTASLLPFPPTSSTPTGTKKQHARAPRTVATSAVPQPMETDEAEQAAAPKSGGRNAQQLQYCEFVMGLPLSAELFLWAEENADEATPIEARRAIARLHKQHSALWAPSSRRGAGPSKAMQAGFLSSLEAVNPTAAAAARAAARGFDEPSPATTAKATFKGSSAIAAASAAATAAITAAAAATASAVNTTKEAATWSVMGSGNRTLSAQKAAAARKQPRGAPTASAHKPKARNRPTFPSPATTSTPLMDSRRSQRVAAAVSKPQAARYWEGGPPQPTASAAPSTGTGGRWAQ
jgi:hypothetical protein